MKVNQVEIDLFAIVFVGLAVALGVLDLIDWWVILLVLLSRIRFALKFKRTSK